MGLLDMQRTQLTAEDLMIMQEDRAAGIEDQSIGRRIEKCAAGDRMPVVYFLSAAGANLIKIGHVARRENVTKRMEALQAGCPYPLVHVFSLVPAGRIEESRLHKLYADQSFRGEWFRCEGPLKAFLQYAAAYPEDAAQKMLLRLGC
jgi:hypothetical protein